MTARQPLSEAGTPRVSTSSGTPGNGFANTGPAAFRATRAAATRSRVVAEGSARIAARVSPASPALARSHPPRPDHDTDPSQENQRRFGCPYSDRLLVPGSV